MDVKTLCLGVLMLEDASGYEIKKHFEEGPFAHFHTAGFGSIYPALTALHAEGKVTFRELAQDGRPDKKVYSITEAGRDAFRLALQKLPGPDSYRSEAVFMMFFGDLLDRDHLRQVYERHLSSYVDRLARMRRTDGGERECAAEQRFVHGLGLAVYRATIDYLRDNRPLLLGEDPGEAPPRKQTAAPPRQAAE